MNCNCPMHHLAAGVPCVCSPRQPSLLDVGRSVKPPSKLKPENPESESNEFYTPSPLATAISDLLDVSFTIDASATAESKKCPRYYSLADDAFRQDFTGEDVWNNPEYDPLGPWFELALRWMTLQPGARSWTHLVPANRSDQMYWWDNVGRFVDLPANRVRFPIAVSMPNSKVIQLSRAVECAPRPFVIDRHEITGRIPFGFPGDPEGLTSRGGSFPSLVLHWRRVQTSGPTP